MRRFIRFTVLSLLTISLINLDPGNRLEAASGLRILAGAGMTCASLLYLFQSEHLMGPQMQALGGAGVFGGFALIGSGLNSKPRATKSSKRAYVVSQKLLRRPTASQLPPELRQYYTGKQKGTPPHKPIPKNYNPMEILTGSDYWWYAENVFFPFFEELAGSVAQYYEAISPAPVIERDDFIEPVLKYIQSTGLGSLEGFNVQSMESHQGTNEDASPQIDSHHGGSHHHHGDQAPQDSGPHFDPGSPTDFGGGGDGGGHH
jgi:hypothetical protein